MFTSISLAALVFLPAVLAQLTVSTPPSLVQCEPAALSWSGGTGPYFPSVIPGGQPGATALESFPEQTGTSYTWTAVNIPTGTSITIEVRDSTGAVQYSSPISIAAGTDNSCLTASASGASTAASSTSSSAAGASSSAMSSSMSSMSMSMSMPMSTSASAPAIALSSTMSGASKASSAAASASNAATSAAASASASAKSGAASNFHAGLSTIAGLAGLLGLAYLL